MNIFFIKLEKMKILAVKIKQEIIVQFVELN